MMEQSSTLIVFKDGVKHSFDIKFKTFFKLLVALPYRAPYSCSKHASLAFFDSLRGEERPNLHILNVNAGYVNVGFFY